MNDSLSDDTSTRTVRIRDQEIPVWPEGQKISPLKKSLILMTRFDDVQLYHSDLSRKILDMEKNSEYKTDYERGGCGIKIYRLDRWKSAEADLIYQRALFFFSKVFKCAEPVVDLSMANIYRKGEYCIPHSHIRTQASLIYSVASGDEDPEHARSGRLLITDPRIPLCCQEEPGRMTTPLVLDMQPGTLYMFPSEVMHFVTPYTGESPRITLNWDISTRSIPGDAIPGGLPEH